VGVKLGLSDGRTYVEGNGKRTSEERIWTYSTTILRAARNGGRCSIVRAITLTGLDGRNVWHAFEFLELHTNFR
jgi:hypothetical protein